LTGGGSSGAVTLSIDTGTTVDLTTAQTLTNKTLTAPTLTSPNITTALTLAGAAGTNGQVLTSAGSGLPTWSTPSSGALVFISSQTVSTAVASVDFTSGISATYDDYVVYFSGVTNSSSASLSLRLYKSAAFVTSNTYSASSAEFRSTPVYASNISATGIAITNSNLTVSTSVLSGVAKLLNMNSALAFRATVNGEAFYNTSGSPTQSTTIFGGSESTAVATTGFQFFLSAGNISAGNFRLYGVAKS
jgi:hypothetical protein